MSDATLPPANEELITLSKMNGEDGVDKTLPFVASNLQIGSEADGTPALDKVIALPGYEIVSELGRGGMGVVYQARQLKLNRLVALKMILHGSHATAAEMVRFLAEGEAVAQLQHSNIVQIHEIGQHDGLPFFCLEYVEGGTLAQRLQGGPLPPSEAARLAEMLSHAMAYAHSRGLVHRDLKPSNVLLAGDGTPKITDFGLVKRLDPTTPGQDHGAGLTATGAVLGTPSYMAPEQAGGKKDLSALCDVYAIGAILYEMVTGRPPFRAPTALDTILQVVNEEPVPPSRLQPGLPRDLETICLKCLQKEPHKRYASATDLADDLALFREDRPIVARRTSWPERAWRWCKRNPSVATLSAVAAGIVVAATILLFQERSQTLKNLARAEGAESNLTGQLELTEKAEHDRTEQLGKSYRDQAAARLFSRQVGQRLESLKALAEAARIARSQNQDDAVIEDLRRKAIVCLALPDLRMEKELAGWSDQIADYVIADSFERYALRDKQGVIGVRRVADGEEIFQLPSVPSGIMLLSPDGHYLSILDQTHHPAIWDIDGKKPVLKWEPGLYSGVMGFTPDSRQVLVYFADSSFGIYALPSGQEVKKWKGTTGCSAVVFHPDGKQFAAGCGNRLIQIWQAETGGLVTELTQSGNIAGGCWGRDGRHLVVTNDGDPLVRIWDVMNNREVGVLEGHKNLGINATLSPTSDLVASSGWEHRMRLWDLHTGRQLLHTPSWGCRFSRTGDRILLTPKSPQIWELADGREYRTFVRDSLHAKREVYKPSISPDGRFLASGTVDGTAIWEMATGNLLANLQTGLTYSVLFQPNGELLTSSQWNGVARWRISTLPGGEGRYRIEPPETLYIGSTDRLEQSQDGRIVVVAVSGQGGLVLDPSHPGELKPLLPHPGTNCITVSPDGKWAATGCHHGTGIKVWSVPENKLACDLPISGPANATFSPDGRWLATSSSGGHQLWKVGTWECGPKLPEGEAAFPPNSSLVGVRSETAISFIDPDTGRTVMTVEDPNQDRLGGTCFSFDGAYLAYSTQDSYSVHVWDLRQVRAGLKAINLDWGAPDYPPPYPASTPVRSLDAFEGLPGIRTQPSSPLVVLSERAATNRAATREQISGWIKHLADEDVKTRDEAARALEEVGQPALKALEEANDHPSKLVRERSKQILDRIEVGVKIAPRRISLKFKDTPVSEAVKAFSDKTGIQISYTPPLGNAKTVNLELNDIPLIQARDHLLQSAGLVTVFQYQMKGWQLMDGKPAPTESLAYGGPFRLQAINLNFHRNIDLQADKQAREELVVLLAQEVEPGSAIATAGQPRVVEARDDTGQSLNLTAQRNDFFSPIQDHTQVAVSLRPPTVRGGTLKDLKIVLPVEVMARNRDMVAIPDPVKATGKVFRGDDDVRVAVQNVNSFGNGAYQIQFAVSVREGRTLNTGGLGFRLTYPKGAEYQTSFLNIETLSITVREFEPEDLLWFGSSPLGLLPGQLPWAALAPTQGRMKRTRWMGIAQFFTPEATGTPAKLTLHRFDRLRTEVPFEFHNLPLP